MRFTVPVHFQKDKEQAWSLNFDFSASPEERTLAEVSLLFPERAPQDLLQPGSQFVLFDGSASGDLCVEPLTLIFIGLLITRLQLPPEFVAHVAQITILEARSRVQLFLLGLAGSQHLPPVACHIFRRSGSSFETARNGDGFLESSIPIGVCARLRALVV